MTGWMVKNGATLLREVTPRTPKAVSSLGKRPLAFLVEHSLPVLSSMWSFTERDFLLGSFPPLFLPNIDFFKENSLLASLFSPSSSLFLLLYPLRGVCVSQVIFNRSVMLNKNLEKETGRSDGKIRVYFWAL